METNNLMLQTIYIAISLSYFYLILNVGRCNLFNLFVYKTVVSTIIPATLYISQELAGRLSSK